MNTTLTLFHKIDTLSDSTPSLFGRNCEFCFHSKTVLLVFKSDRIVVGMVLFFGGGGRGNTQKRES